MNLTPLEIVYLLQCTISKNPLSFVEFLHAHLWSREVIKHKKNYHRECFCYAKVCDNIRRVSNPECCMAPDCLNDKHHYRFSPKQSWWCPICKQHSTDPKKCVNQCDNNHTDNDPSLLLCYTKNFQYCEVCKECFNNAIHCEVCPNDPHHSRPTNQHLNYCSDCKQCHEKSNTYCSDCKECFQVDKMYHCLSPSCSTNPHHINNYLQICPDPNCTLDPHHEIKQNVKFCTACNTCHSKDHYFCKDCQACFKHYKHCTSCKSDPHHIEKCVCKWEGPNTYPSKDFLCPAKLEVSCDDCKKCHVRDTKAKHPSEYLPWSCIADRFKDDMFYCHQCDKCYNASEFKPDHPDHDAVSKQRSFVNEWDALGIDPHDFDPEW